VYSKIGGLITNDVRTHRISFEQSIHTPEMSSHAAKVFGHHRGVKSSKAMLNIFGFALKFSNYCFDAMISSSELSVIIPTVYVFRMRSDHAFLDCSQTLTI
jgi:hypothetical protein